MSKNKTFLVGNRYDEFMKNKVYTITGKTLFNSFGWYKNNIETNDY